MHNRRRTRTEKEKNKNKNENKRKTTKIVYVSHSADEQSLSDGTRSLYGGHTRKFMTAKYISVTQK